MAIMNKTILMDVLNDELKKQGKSATTKSKIEYINGLLDSLLLTASEYIKEDVEIDSLLEKK